MPCLNVAVTTKIIAIKILIVIKNVIRCNHYVKEATFEATEFTKQTILISHCMDKSKEPQGCIS